ncbi:hypothetical protein GPJ56_001594 [Histomonas meleagridis]|uniref:uncharacterized protein n=1 Tax=Histomonas meleagridis TaxID=135588 RepID=UPI00355A4F3B|nr:hypothetical protein GPJ56_001594 [Histomonas meleagridis]KAH0807100.1 hypothetical protein GO595_000276 [Histomonas meleagridis]
MTEVSFSFYAKAKLGKKYELNKRMNYFSIRGLTLIPKKSLDFKCDDEKFSLTKCDVDEIGNALRRHLCTFLKVNELPDFDFPNKENPNVQLSPGLRFLAKKFNDLQVISHNDIDLLHEYFAKSPKAFIASYFKSFLPYLDLLLNAVSVAPSIKVLIIDVETTNAIASSLANLIRLNTTFTELIFAAPIKGDTSSIAAAFSREPPSPIDSLKIRDFKIDENTINSIVQILSVQTLHTLQLKRCLKGDYCRQFFNKLDTNSRFKDIQSLDLTSTDGIDVEKLFPLIGKIRHLKLKSCDLEVSQVLEALVTFHPAGTGYSISIANASFHTGTWNKFFEGLSKQVNTCLSSFNWTDNPLDQRLFFWLNSLPALNTVIFNECLKDDRRIIPRLTNFIEKATKLRELIIDEDDDYVIKSADAKSIISSLKRNYSLVTVSFKGQRFDDEIIRDMGEVLLANRRITTLNYNFLGAESIKSILYFFQSLVDRGIKLQIDWPESTIKALGRIDPNDMKDLKEAYDIVIKGNKNIKPPFKSTVFADENGEIPLAAATVEKVGKSGLNYNANRPVNLPPPPPQTTNIQNNSLPPQPKYIYVDVSHRDDTRTHGEYKPENNVSKLPSELVEQLYPELAKNRNNRPMNSPPSSPQQQQQQQQQQIARPGILPPPLVTPPPPPKRTSLQNETNQMNDDDNRRKTASFDHKNMQQNQFSNRNVPKSPIEFGDLPSVPGMSLDLPPAPNGINNLPPPPGMMNLDLPPPPQTGIDLPPPPSRGSNISDLPPPPGKMNLDLPPPPQTGIHDLPPPPGKMNLDLPPPPSRGSNISDLPPPPGKMNLDLPPPPQTGIHDLPPPPGKMNLDLPPPPSRGSNISDLPPPPGKMNLDLPPPPQTGINDLPPPPKMMNLDLPPPPQTGIGNLPPPPPSRGSSISDLPPPPGMMNLDLPPPPSRGNSISDLPPPPKMMNLDLPPPPKTGISDLPPPPQSRGSSISDLPPPPGMMNLDLPPPPTRGSSIKDLPPPPPIRGSGSSDLPPPPIRGSSIDDLPPPPTMMSLDLPPPPQTAISDLPPPPNRSGISDLPPPPGMNFDLPPPPQAGIDLPTPQSRNSINDLPPPPGMNFNLPPPSIIASEPEETVQRSSSPIPPPIEINDLPPIPTQGNMSILPPPPTMLNNDLPLPPTQNKIDLPPPPTMTNNDLPLPPSQNKIDLPPPPKMVNNDLPLPPPSEGRIELPPPPMGMNNDLPPPPPSDGRMDLPPPPIMMSSGDLPPPPMMMSSGDLPPPPIMMSSGDLPIGEKIDLPPPPAIMTNEIQSIDKDDEYVPNSTGLSFDGFNGNKKSNKQKGNIAPKFSLADLPKFDQQSSELPPPPPMSINIDSTLRPSTFDIDLPPPPIDDNMQFPPMPTDNKNQHHGDIPPPQSSIFNKLLNQKPPPPSTVKNNNINIPPPPPIKGGNLNIPPPPIKNGNLNIPPPPIKSKINIPPPPVSVTKNASSNINIPPPPKFANKVNIPPPPSNLPPPPSKVNLPPPPPTINEQPVERYLTNSRPTDNFPLPKLRPQNRQLKRYQPPAQNIPLMAQFGFGNLGFH